MSEEPVGLVVKIKIFIRQNPGAGFISAQFLLATDMPSEEFSEHWAQAHKEIESEKEDRKVAPAEPVQIELPVELPRVWKVPYRVHLKDTIDERLERYPQTDAELAYQVLSPVISFAEFAPVFRRRKAARERLGLIRKEKAAQAATPGRKVIDSGEVQVPGGGTVVYSVYSDGSLVMDGERVPDHTVPVVLHHLRLLAEGARFDKF